MPNTTDPLIYEALSLLLREGQVMALHHAPRAVRDSHPLRSEVTNAARLRALDALYEMERAVLAQQDEAAEPPPAERQLPAERIVLAHCETLWAEAERDRQAERDCLHDAGISLSHLPHLRRARELAEARYHAVANLARDLGIHMVEGR